MAERSTRLVRLKRASGLAGVVGEEPDLDSVAQLEPRHPDVHQHDIRIVLGDGLLHLVPVGSLADDFDVCGAGEITGGNLSRPRSRSAFRHYRGDEPPVFAHDSERDVAALLDEAGIPWLYEPTTSSGYFAVMEPLIAFRFRAASENLSKTKEEPVATESEDLTKEQLLNKLSSERKDDLVSALGSKLSKDDLVNVLGSRLKKDELVQLVDSIGEDSSDEGDDEQEERDEPQQWQRQEGDSDSGSQASTPAYPGGAPSMAGRRVRVDLRGLPMLGVFAGRGASAAGTIIDGDAQKREIRVWLDAAFAGEKEIVVPPERLSAED